MHQSNPPSPKPSLKHRLQRGVYENVTVPIFTTPGYIYKKTGETIANTPLYQNAKTQYKDASDAIDSAKAQAFKKLLDIAEKRPKWADGIARFFYNINLVAAFAFDSLLFYTPGRAETPPVVVGFFTKLLVIAAAYVVINAALSLIIYGIFIPAFYASYVSSYRCFQTYLTSQYKAYYTKFGVKLMEESGDLKTMGILAVFETVAHTKHNPSTNIGEYRSFINNDIDTALKALETPKLDHDTIQQIKDYFMRLPDDFKDYAKIKESYVYRSIQYWVLMLCVVLFVIPIKYTILNSNNSPELPSALTNTASMLGNRIGSGMSTIGSMMQKSARVGVDSGG